MKNRFQRITLAYYYGIGLVSATISIAVVIVLNFFTPLHLMQNRLFENGQTLSPELALNFFLPRLIVVLVLSYVFIFLSLRHMLKPISKCLAMHKAKVEPVENLMKAAQRRLLNLHFYYIQMNILLWIFIPAFVAVAAIFGEMLDKKTAIIFAVRASMVGLISSSIGSQRIEIVSRKMLIPFFFPTGELSQIKGTKKISISKRISMVNRLGAIVPVFILLVTLLTLQWELETSKITAIEYGKSLIVFTLILTGWTIIFSNELSRLLSLNILSPINDLVTRLKGVEKGAFEEKVQVTSNDEIGYAGEVVNAMVQGLKEREAMQQSLHLAQQIQKNLLPTTNPLIPGVDIAGTTLYCDETGGDYYDFLLPENNKSSKIRIVLGDVSGHGISSALLMATTRALFRLRSSMPGNLSDIIGDVNNHLCEDVGDSGNFMTLFCMELDLEKKSLKWVRAGHDPALLFHPQTNAFSELKGKGIALGVTASTAYTENEIQNLTDNQIVVLYTDGIHESENPAGEPFGKARLKEIVESNSEQSARSILESVISASHEFRESEEPKDDLTLIIVKLVAGNK